MTFGSPTSDFNPHDPFAVVMALKSHHIATKKMAREVRERVAHEGRANADWRRQQQQALHNSNRRLHKMKGDSQLIKSSAPPSAAAQFDVAIKDPRTPRPHHKGCQIQSVAEWAKLSPRTTSPRGAESDAPHPPVVGRTPREISLVNSATSGGGGGAGILLSSLTTAPHAAVVLSTTRSRGGPFGATFTSGVGGGTCNTLVPLHDGNSHLSLPAIDRISPRVISNAESDFTMLSYGHTHAHAALFRELPEEYVFDFNGRRVPVVQFLKYFERTGLETLSFPQYIHLVYSHPMEDCVAAVKHFSAIFGWAANLSESTAKMVATLWLRWTDDGNIPFTLETFMEMHHVNPRNQRRVAELEVIFHASDYNDDGVFDKDEFAAFFSGGETEDTNDGASGSHHSSPRGERRRASSPPKATTSGKRLGSMRSPR